MERCSSRIHSAYCSTVHGKNAMSSLPQWECASSATKFHMVSNNTNGNCVVVVPYLQGYCNPHASNTTSPAHMHHEIVNKRRRYWLAKARRLLAKPVEPSSVHPCTPLSSPSMHAPLPFSSATHVILHAIPLGRAATHIARAIAQDRRREKMLKLSLFKNVFTIGRT